ncbi:MAG: FHA domain-containing protein [Cyanobacteria bacterium J06642_2]
MTAQPEEPTMIRYQHVLQVEDRDGVREVILGDPKYFIGRDIANDICLNSQFASRYHASLLRVPAEQGDYSYQVLDGDLEGKPSTNGLYVNDRKVNSHTLDAGDVITFGPDAKLTYQLMLKNKSVAG